MSCRKRVYVYRTGCSGRRTTTGYSWSYSWGTQARVQPVVVSKPKVTRVVTPVVVKKSTTTSTAVKKPATAAPSTSTKQPTATVTGTPFAQAVLAEHNRLRAKHSAKPLKLNAAISRHAQEWADNLARRDTMYHRPNNKYGENCHQYYTQMGCTGAEVVRSWYSEIKYYTFGQAQPADWYKVGHFTAVVWKGTTELGVGIARNSRMIYIVCNYNPPGNFTNRYAINVTRN